MLIPRNYRSVDFDREGPGRVGSGIATTDALVTAGFLCRAGAQTTPNFQENFKKISKFLSEGFSQWWIPKLRFWYPPLGLNLSNGCLNLCFSWSSGLTPLCFLFCLGTHFLRRLSPKLVSQHQRCIKNLPSSYHCTRDCHGMAQVLGMPLEDHRCKCLQ